MVHVNGLSTQPLTMTLTAMCEEGLEGLGSRISVPALVPLWQERGTVWEEAEEISEPS